MATLKDVRSWTDEDLEESQQFMQRAGLFGETYDAIGAELARRGEIRVVRVLTGQAQPGEKHDASWYESRQTEQQWLDEIGQ